MRKKSQAISFQAAQGFAKRTGGHRGRAVLAMDCALGGTEWARHARPLN
jgi:hypothetical protein